MEEETEQFPENEEEDAKIEDRVEDLFEGQIGEGDEEDVIGLYENLAIDKADSVEAEDVDLFYKNTPSFRCLAQLNISRSSILRHPLYSFPPLIDPGLDDILDYQEPPPELDTTGCRTYSLNCENLGIVPISRVLKSLPTNKIDLMYYGLTENQMFAITAALKENNTVQDIILQDNWLTPTSVQHISDMLKENKNIRCLNLRECRIQPEGAYNLSPGLMESTSLKELDLSFNSLENKGIRNLEAGLIVNWSITKLNLSHNNFGEDAADCLGKIISKSNSYVDLDLSWNRLFTPQGNKALFKAMCNNHSIKVLNMSWNGIGARPAVTPIQRYLKKTDVLEHFDISSNRLTGDCLGPIRLGLAKCKTLISAKIGNNPIKPDEAVSVVNIFKTPISLNILDMENVFVTKKFVPLWETYAQMGKTIIIGGVLSNYKIIGPNITQLLYQRARFLAMKAKSKKAQKDFGHFILKLPEESIPKADFLEQANQFKMKKVDLDLLNAIADTFVKKEKIDCVAMRASYMSYYPDTVLPPPKPKKEKKAKKDKKGKKGTGADGIQSEVQTEYEGSEEGEEEEEEYEEENGDEFEEYRETEGDVTAPTE